MRNYDLDFLKRFSLVIGFLTLVTIGLIVGSYFVHKSLPGEVDPGVAHSTVNRARDQYHCAPGSTPTPR